MVTKLTMLVAALAVSFGCARRGPPVSEAQVAAAARAALEVAGPEAEARYRFAIGDLPVPETARARAVLGDLERAVDGTNAATPLVEAASRYATATDTLIVRCRELPARFHLTGPQSAWKIAITATHANFRDAESKLRAALARFDDEVGIASR